MEEKGFYVKVVCKSGGRVAISLYKALESLTSFNVQSPNLATVSDRIILTFTLNVRKPSSVYLLSATFFSWYVPSLLYYSG